MEKFPFKRAVVKCNNCGFMCSSVYELSTHPCYRTIRSQNMAQRSPGIYKPNVMNRTSVLSQNLRSFRSPTTRQTNVRDILQDVKNDQIANLSNVHYGYRSPVISPKSQQSSWGEIINESEIPIPVLQSEPENKFSSARNRSYRNNEHFTQKPAIIYQQSPPYFMERASSPILAHQLLDKPDTDHYFDKRRSNMNVASGSELGTETSSGPRHVMLISPSNKEITIVSLDDVIHELEKRLGELPYEIRLQLEYEFLQNVQNAVDEEQSRTTSSL